METKPHFHEWASVLPGNICLSRKARNATFRNYVAAETATPVIGCAACIPAEEAKQFYFAGICRSKTVRPNDDGVGPSVDEFFTLAIGGMATLQNNSKESVFPGDMIEDAVRRGERRVWRRQRRPGPAQAAGRRCRAACRSGRVADERARIGRCARPAPFPAGPVSMPTALGRARSRPR